MATGTDSLRMIRKQEIPKGSALPGNLCDFSGRVLMRAGQVFTDEAAVQLSKKVLYVGGDWPVLESDREDDKPEEVMEALADQRGEAVIEDDRRKHYRHEWDVDLKVRVRDTGQKMTEREIQVVACDISAGGFSFVHGQFIYPGSLVTVTFDALPHRPTLTGEVRSCVSIGGVQHRVGVQFVDPPRPKRKPRR